MHCGSRRREEALHGLCQLFQAHRLVELDAVMTYDSAQRACRYVTRQDDDGDPTMKLRAQLLNNLEPIQSLRQIVIRKDEIRSELASRDKLERGDPVWSCGGVATLVLKQQIKETAHLGIILDDQDSACTLRRFGDRLIDFWLTVFHVCGG